MTEMNRADKLRLLESIINEGNQESLKSLKLGDILFVNLRYDEDKTRIITADVNRINAFNYNFEEIKTLRLMLLKKYSIVWLEEKTF